MTKRHKSLGWYLFAATMILLGLIAVLAAVAVGTHPRWPTAYPGSMASRLTADYGSELDALLAMAPLRVDLIQDLLADEGVENAPSGPVATLVAVLFGTPTPTVPGATPEASPTPTLDPDSLTRTPTRTPSPTPDSDTPTPTPTPTPTQFYTLTPIPTSTPLPTLTPTLRPTLPPTREDPTDTPTPDTPTKTPTGPVSVVATPEG